LHVTILFFSALPVKRASAATDGDGST